MKRLYNKSCFVDLLIFIGLHLIIPFSVFSSNVGENIKNSSYYIYQNKM